MPDITFDALEKIPDGLREYAKQSDGKYVVSVAPNVKLQEFRDNNINLAKERDTYKGKWEAVSPIIGDDVDGFKTRYTEYDTMVQQVKDGKLKGSDAIQKEVDARVKAVSEGYTTQLKDLSTKLTNLSGDRDTWKSKFERSVLHREITNAVVAKDSPANPEALPDITARFERLFTVSPDGKLIPKRGDEVIYGADGASPMSPKEWLTKEIMASPYLGKASTGGGAGGGRGSGDSFGMSQADFQKLSPQQRITMAREKGK